MKSLSDLRLGNKAKIQAEIHDHIRDFVTKPGNKYTKEFRDEDPRVA